MNKLEIKNLYVRADEKNILNGINLTINKNEVHALMGPNGNGKSTLLSTIMGHPDYEITEGEILLDGQSLKEMSIDERSRLGIFLAMQNPVEIKGLNNIDFLKSIINAHREKPITLIELYKLVEDTIKKLKIDKSIVDRHLNVNFSGGEKKKNEILQLSVLKPELALIDEIDSGLDIDALNVVSRVINELIQENKMTGIIVSHYDRFYSLVPPTHAHVIINGQIVFSGGIELVNKINNEGYSWLANELGIDINKKRVSKLSGVGCAAIKAK